MRAAPWGVIHDVEVPMRRRVVACGCATNQPIDRWSRIRKQPSIARAYIGRVGSARFAACFVNCGVIWCDVTYVRGVWEVCLWLCANCVRFNSTVTTDTYSSQPK